MNDSERKLVNELAEDFMTFSRAGFDAGLRAAGVETPQATCQWCHAEFEAGRICHDERVGIHLCPGCAYCLEAGSPSVLMEMPH